VGALLTEGNELGADVGWGVEKMDAVRGDMVPTEGRVEKGEDCIGEALVTVEVHKFNVVVLAAREDEIENVVVGCAKGPASPS